MAEKKDTSDAASSLVPDKKFQSEIGIGCSMTLWRWERDPDLAPQMPKRIKIRNRNYRRRGEIEAFKSWLQNRGLDQAG